MIGKPMPRLDSRAQSTGSALFGMDVIIPGMLNAAIRTAPSFTGAVVAIRNEAEILKRQGVHAMVRIAAVAVAKPLALYMIFLRIEPYVVSVLQHL